MGVVRCNCGVCYLTCCSRLTIFLAAGCFRRHQTCLKNPVLAGAEKDRRLLRSESSLINLSFGLVGSTGVHADRPPLQVYFLAWHFNIIVTVVTATAMALIAYPRARTLLFPPMPLAMVDWLSGGITAPRAGVLGSGDTATGAPQTIHGEAAENEASNFITGIAGIAMNVMTAQEPNAEPENLDGETHAMTDGLPQPNEATTLIATAKDKSAGIDKPSHDKTKRPMEEAMWSKMLPLLRALWVISDTWERFSK